jgi:hypothetical protein
MRGWAGDEVGHSDTGSLALAAANKLAAGAPLAAGASMPRHAPRTHQLCCWTHAPCTIGPCPCPSLPTSPPTTPPPPGGGAAHLEAQLQHLREVANCGSPLLRQLQDILFVLLGFGRGGGAQRERLGAAAAKEGARAVRTTPPSAACVLPGHASAAAPRSLHARWCMSEAAARQVWHLGDGPRGVLAPRIQAGGAKALWRSGWPPGRASCGAHRCGGDA